MSTRLITPGELLQAATGVSWNDIAESGNTNALEVIEQSKIIDRASALASRIAFDNTGRFDATTDSEEAILSPHGDSKAFVNRNGWLTFRANYYPVLSVTSMQWAIASAGTAPPIYNALDVTKLMLEGEDFRINRIRDYTQDWSWLKLNVGRVKVTYVDGWPNTYLTGSTVNAGSNVTLTVETTLGMTGVAGAIGNSLTIADGINSETVTVASVTDSTHVVVNSLANAHTPGALPYVVGVSAVPDDVKEAVILLCTHLARQRGTDALTMAASGGGATITSATSGGSSDAFGLAKSILAGYARVRF